MELGIFHPDCKGGVMAIQSRKFIARFSLIACAALLTKGGAAQACSFPEMQYNPKVQKADVVLVGVVTNKPSPKAPYRDAEVTVSRVVSGTYSQRTYAIPYSVFFDANMCTTTPYPKQGETFAIYLQRSAKGNLGYAGRLPLNEAIKIDRRLQNTTQR